MEYYSVIKNKKCHLDGYRDYHTKRSKSEENKYRMVSLIYGI